MVPVVAGAKSIQEVVSLLTDQLTIVVDKLVARLTSTRVSPRRVLTVLRRRAGLLVILHAFVYIVTELSYNKVKPETLNKISG